MSGIINLVIIIYYIILAYIQWLSSVNINQRGDPCWIQLIYQLETRGQNIVKENIGYEPGLHALLPSDACQLKSVHVVYI